MTLRHDEERIVLAVVRIAGQGRVRLDDCVPDCGNLEWRIVMTTEDETFTDLGRVPAIVHDNRVTIAFDGPAGVVLEGRQPRT